jgi:hypothetical protein
MKGIQPVVTTTGKSFSDFGKAVTKTATDVQKLPDAAGKASNVLTNLSRVASDAPFGFIAIQNNLDPLIDSFGRLQKSSGSTIGAIKGLAASLAGPAGLAVGFSVVSSLVTSAIQKYGSLGNALSELGAASDTAAVNQRRLTSAINDSIAGTTGEIGKLQDYITILTNTNNSLSQRTSAYNELKKVYPGVIQDLTTENALTEAGAQLIRNRSIALIDYIRLKGQESALVKLVEEETSKSLKTAQSQIELLKNQNTLTNKLINNFLGAGNAGVGFYGRLNSGNKELENGAQSIDFFNQSLLRVREQLTKANPEVVDPAAAQKAEDAAKKAAQSADDAAKKAIAAQQKILETILKRYKAEQEAIKITSGIYSQSYLEATKKVLTAQANLDIFKVSKDSGAVKAIRENLTAQLSALDDEFKKRRFEAGSIDFTPIFKLDKAAAQQRLRELAQAIAAEGRKSLRLPEDIYGEALKTAPKKLELKPQVVFSDDVKQQIERQTRNAIQLERLQGLATAATEIFSGILNPVVDSFFSNVEKGETVFQALGKSIKQFAANAVKDLLKLALLSGIKSLLFGGGIGGFGRSFTGGLSGLGGGIGGVLGGLNIGGVAPAPLSLNVGGQFNLRGTDLVASVNQANQRIGRVG